METYNLTFAGEILPGHDPGEARHRFSKALGIEDTERLESFFTGAVITLRRNLDREAALRFQERMARIGIRLTVVSDSGQIDLELPVANTDPAEKAPTTSTGNTRKKAESRAPSKTQGKRRKTRKRSEQSAAASPVPAITDAAEAMVSRPSPARFSNRPGHKERQEEMPKSHSGTRRKKSRSGYRVGNLPQQNQQPNLFSLRPFRNDSRIQQRADRAGKLALAGLGVGAFALTALLMLAVRFFTLAGSAPPPQLLALAATEGGRLAAASDDTLYLLDRSGALESNLKLAALGIPQVQQLAFGHGQTLLALAGDEPDSAQLWRCEPFAEPVSACSSLQGNFSSASALAVDNAGKTLFLADPEKGEILKLTAGGEILASSAAVMPAEPALLSRDGLLYLNHPEGPVLQVLRPDTSGFGQVLDQLYLSAASPDTPVLSPIASLAATRDYWWTLHVGEKGMSLLLRSDSKFGAGQPTFLDTAAAPGGLLKWQERLLVHGSDATVARFALDGTPQVALQITGLAQDRANEARAQGLTRTIWGGAFATLALLATVGFIVAAYQRLRAMVYQPGRQRGAGSIEDLSAEVSWVANNTRRSDRARQLLFAYCGVFGLVIGGAALLLQVPLPILGALLVIAIGPAAALVLLATTPAGHIGQLRDRILVVDHKGRYHLGEGASIQYRNHFVLVDDVVVYLGTKLLPNFDISAIKRDIEPLVTTGVRIQRRAIAVRLLENRHPVSLAIMALGGSLLAGVSIVLLTTLG